MFTHLIRCKVLSVLADTVTPYPYVLCCSHYSCCFRGLCHGSDCWLSNCFAT